MADLRELSELEQEWVIRARAYSEGITWFGRSGIGRSFAAGTAALVYSAHNLYAQLVQRFTLLASEGEDLIQVAAELGAEQGGATRATALGIPLPVTSPVSAITGGKVEIPTGEGADWGTWAVRLRNGDGSITEVLAVAAITAGTGPNGGDELDLTTISGIYSPTTEDVAVIARITVPPGQVISTTEGISFETLEEVITSDANPIFAGSTPVLSLADKAWCEAQTAGARGNVGADTFTDSSPTIPGIVGWYNPAAAEGGSEVEVDADLRYHAAHGPAARNQETLAWLEALAHQANSGAMRAFRATPTQIGTMAVKVLRRTGGVFSAPELALIETYIESRVRSHLVISASNVVRTAIEIEAIVNIDPDYTLREVHLTAARNVANYLDWRRWEGGVEVDEASLLALVRQTEGVTGLETGSFLPAANTVVAEDSVPHLVRVSLQNAATGATINATFAQSF